MTLELKKVEIESNPIQYNFITYKTVTARDDSQVEVPEMEETTTVQNLENQKTRLENQKTEVQKSIDTIDEKLAMVTAFEAPVAK